MTPQAAAGVPRCARPHRAEAAPRATVPPCGEERALYPVCAALPSPSGDGAPKGRMRGILPEIPGFTPHPAPLPRERESISPTKTYPPFAPWNTACGFRDGRPSRRPTTCWTAWWSRRIDRRHRLVYRVVGNGDGRRVEMVQCRRGIEVRWSEAPPSTRSCAACTDSPPILALHSFFPEARRRYPGPTGGSALQGGFGWSRVFAREK